MALTTEQAAAALGCTAARVRQLLAAGRIRGAVKHGPKLRGVWEIPAGKDGRPVVEPARKGRT